MTPAVTALEQAGVWYKLHEYAHSTDNQRYGDEAVARLGLTSQQVFKTLVVELDSKSLAVAIVPVSMSLNLKQLAKQLKTKRAELAEPRKVERTTGYVLGGVSPLGQKRLLSTVIDRSAEDQQTIFISAGKRGLEIEIEPKDLLSLLDATYSAIGISK